MMKNDTNKVEEKENVEKVEESKNAEDISKSEEVADAFVPKEEFEALKELSSQIEGLYKRALADYQNLQKRVNEEKREWIRSANKDLILRILTVLDTLMLAQQHMKDQSIDVSVQQFLDVLKSEGVTRIETDGKSFNPHEMECIVTEPGEENKVLSEIRAGYIMNEFILRPAQVKVGSGK